MTGEHDNRLRLVVDNAPIDDDGPRILAPGAPPSPAPLPNDLAVFLEHGEVLAWWDEKITMTWELVGITLGAAVLLLLGVTGFAPSFWAQPIAGWGPPVLALLSPTLLVLFREFTGRGAIMVTDRAIIGVDREGTPTRLALGSIDAIRRDLLRGGVTIQSRQHQVRIPPALTDRCRQAVASRMEHRLSGSQTVIDPMGWLS